MATCDDSVFDGFDPMGEDYVKTLNSNYFGGPGFALPSLENGFKPINILVENIPEDLKKEGLIRAFKLANVFPITCKLLQYKGHNKAILHVRSITDATTAIQVLNNQPPLYLKVTLAANQEDFEVKKHQILTEQRIELAKHLRVLGKPINKMGELVSNLCAVENLFKVLSTRDEICTVCSAEIIIRHVHFIVADEVVIDPFDGLPTTEPIKCAYCESEDGKFIVCGDCRVTTYCGLRCQSLAWFNHKKNCVPYQRLTNGDISHIANESTIHHNKHVEVKPPSPKVQPALKIEEETKKDNLSESPVERHHPEPKKIEKKEALKVPEVLSPVKTGVSCISSLSPPLAVRNDNGDFKPTPSNDYGNRVDYFANREENKFIKPRNKISLNNEVNFIRETKLETNAITDVLFSFCYSPSEFYVQRLADISEAEAITDKLQVACARADEWPEARKLKIGNYCAAKFPQDNCWYRAKVLEFIGGKVKVRFIDYGNHDDVEFFELSPLPPELVAIPALAVRCSLKFMKPLYESGWSRDSCKFFEDLVSDEAEVVFSHCKVFNEYEGIHQVELYNDEGAKISDLLVRKGLAVRYEEIRKPIMSRMRRNPELRPLERDLQDMNRASDSASNNDYSKRKFVRPCDDRNEITVEPPVQRKPFVEEKLSKPARSFDVSPPRPQQIVKEICPTEAYKQHCLKKTPASYYHLYKMGTIKEDEAVLLYNDVDDPSIIYVLGNNDSMLKLCAELGDIETVGVHVEPKPGAFVVAPADDGDFYRVLVLDVEGPKCRVFYLDFGNIDVIDNSAILKLPSKISLDKIPAQGIRCRIDNMDQIENFETRLADRIASGSLAEIKVVRKISDHEYAINLIL